MKRNWIALLIAAMALNFAACKKREKPIDPESARIIEEAARAWLDHEEKTPNSQKGPLTEDERQRVTIISVSDSSLSDLRPLVQYPELGLLELYACPRLEELAPLKRLPRLQFLTIVSCPGITDLRPLIDVPRLGYLNVLEDAGIQEIPMGLRDKSGMSIVWRRAPTPTPGPTASETPAI